MRAALAEAWANRSGFWTQVLTMVVNDVAWVAFWALFFHRVGALRGWDTSRVLLLLAILTTAGGVALGFLANARSVGRLAAEGALDAALALPVPTLAYILVRRVNTTNLGDVAFGIGLFAIAGHPSLARTGLYLVGVVSATVLLVGFLVLTGSLAFFARRGRNDVGELSFHAILMFASYPIDMFGGAAKLFLYTVVPAAFVAAIPARLVDSFDPGLALLTLAASTAFAVAGWAAFTIGLKRYTSGAVWTKA
jgi:ABC-2 type transport system permease protein